MKYPANWKKWFDLQTKQDYYSSLIKKVEAGYFLNNLLPDQTQIFKGLELINPEDVQVIILGQDPYHTPGVANGLAFSVNAGQRIPPSLKNIFYELDYEYGINSPFYDLEKWVHQGVLLINTIWTVEPHNPLSCKDWGWKQFSTNLIEWLNQEINPHLIIVCFGKWVAKFIDDLKLKPTVTILQTSHPSPFSFYKGFYKSMIFQKINVTLKSLNKPIIIWK